MKQKIIDWYNAHIVHAWYRSWAIYVGVLAAALPYLLDVLQYVLNDWATLSVHFHLPPAVLEVLRIFLLVVVLPVARAWQQRSMQKDKAK